jgi:hypothetical protein
MLHAIITILLFITIAPHTDAWNQTKDNSSRFFQMKYDTYIELFWTLKNPNFQDEFSPITG